MSKKKSARMKPEPLNMDQFLSIRRTFLPKISPDGKKVLFVSNLGGRYNIWTVGQEGGWPTQVTNQEEMILEADWALGGKAIVFSADYEGNENKQVYIIPAEGGAVRNLTCDKDVQSFLLGASPRGNRIAYSDNRREKDKFDTYVRDLNTDEEWCVLVRSRTGIDIPVDWSPDGNKLLVYRDDHNLNSNIILTSLKTPPDVFEDLTPHEGDALYFGARFSPDGKYAYFIANEDRDFKNIARVNIKVKHRSLEWFREMRGDVAYLTFSRNGKYMAYGANVRGSILPRILALRTGREVKLSLPKGIYSSVNFSRDGRFLVFLYQGPTRPADAWVVDMAAKSRKPRQLTFSLSGGLEPRTLCAPKEISYRSADGLKIQGLFYLPRGAKKNRKLPCILYPHGGPNAQNLNQFSMWFQFLLSRGYAILAPDFRGSTGYGTSFQKLIFRDWGGGDLSDLLKGVEFAKKSGYVDPRRIGTLGMSYGGFAVLSLITQSPQTFRAAVEAYGPANLFTFIASNPPSWAEGVYALVGHPERDRDYLRERSPINYVDRIRTPLLVIQGRNDPRVAQSESDQIVDSLRSRNRPVEYIVFEDEGHGFTKMENQVTALSATARFFEKYL
jgi:dipeptidyl aminopeptidase/acylaminoacyl peptidase